MRSEIESPSRTSRGHTKSLESSPHGACNVGQAPNVSGGSEEVGAQYPTQSTDIVSAEETHCDHNRVGLEPMDESGLNRPLRVRVLFLNLEWGGDTIPVPCRFALGTVLRGVVGADGSPHVQCNFGAYLGVQTVAEPSCEYVPYSLPIRIVDEQLSATSNTMSLDKTIKMEPQTNRGYTTPLG